MQTKHASIGMSEPKILVVDDSNLIRTAAVKILESEYRVLLANDGEEAWQAINADADIQVVFSDLTMPKLDGFALLKRLRESEDQHLNSLPLIIMTTDNDDESRRETALRLGATDFISKPFNSIDLKARAKAHATIESITRELKHKAEQLERNSSKDPLTGLNNRSYFIEKLWQDCAYSARHGTLLSVLRLDVDSFNQFFVQLGKESANKVIVEVAEKISPCLRDEDTAARIGLSTFVIVAPGSALEEAQTLAQNIMHKVTDIALDIDSDNQNATLSVGIVSPVLKDKFRTEDILQDLEQLSLAAMDEGGNKFLPLLKATKKSEARALQEVSDDLVVSVDQALALIEAGKLDKVKQNLSALLQRIDPLIQLADQSLEKKE